MAPISSRSQTTPSSNSLILGFLAPSVPSLVPSLSRPSEAQSPRSLHPLIRSLSPLLRRQGGIIVPAHYSGLTAGPKPGIVVAIVLGSVGGFLLILWLIYTCFNMGAGRTEYVEEEIVRRRSRSTRSATHSSPAPPPPRSPPPRSTHRSPPRSSHRSRSRSEVIEVSRHRSPPRRERRETVVVEETRRSVPAEREDDIVEVIEEHSPPRRVRKSSGRQSERQSERRSGGPSERQSERPSGFRTVDPEAFGGGNGPMRKVSRR